MRATAGAVEPVDRGAGVARRRCPRCKAGLLEATAVDVTRRIGGQEVRARAAAMICAGCGTIVHQRRELQRIELEIAARLVEEGRRDGEVLRYVRRALGLKGKDVARLLEVCAETVSRREQGKVPVDRATLVVLRQMVLDRLRGDGSTESFLASLK